METETKIEYIRFEVNDSKSENKKSSEKSKMILERNKIDKSVAIESFFVFLFVIFFFLLFRVFGVRDKKKKTKTNFNAIYFDDLFVLFEQLLRVICFDVSKYFFFGSRPTIHTTKKKNVKQQAVERGWWIEKMYLCFCFCFLKHFFIFTLFSVAESFIFFYLYEGNWKWAFKHFNHSCSSLCLVKWQESIRTCSSTHCVLFFFLFIRNWLRLNVETVCRLSASTTAPIGLKGFK